MTPIVYGIPNCDTVKTARKWLDAQGISYAFHDYKKAGVPSDRLASWIEAQGWETILNKRGTTFRKLSDAQKADIDASKAQALLSEHASMIKRPIVEHSGGLLVGFDKAAWEAALA